MRIPVIICLLCIPLFSPAQQTIQGTIQHDGLEREYLLYVPAGYSGATPVPLVFNFHGYGSNAFEQMWYGDFRAIADTAGFLIVHPQGTLLNGTTHFNVGGWTLGSTADDVGFTATLIDSLSAQYSIDQDRIYATGMSNGGFMSFVLACQLSERIAAIASVTGSMTPETYTTCNPSHPMPVLQMHGTADLVVPYGGALWTKSVQDVLDYWVAFNGCSTIPNIVDLPDTAPQDGSTVQVQVYEQGDNGATVEHYKVTGGGHTWPGTIFGSAGTNQDIRASQLIWQFFSKYDLGSLTLPSATDPAQPMAEDWSLSPNPASTMLVISRNASHDEPYALYDIHGQLLMTGLLTGTTCQLDIQLLPVGIHVLRTPTRSKRIIVQH